MAKYLSGTYTSTYTLTVNPTTVTSQGLIKVGGSANGLYGPNGTTWSVTNLGTIEAIGVGVSLAGGGLVVNGASNATHALIYGGFGFSSPGPGISIGTTAGGMGTVINYGTIIGGAFGSNDIDLKFGGSVTNAASGYIRNATGAAINIGTAGGTVTNFGTIAGSTDGAINILSIAGLIDNFSTIKIWANAVHGTGLHLSNGGTVVNHASGRVLGAGSGVQITNLGGNLINYGTIQSIRGLQYPNAGVFISGAGTVKNFGVIQYTGGSGTVGTGAYLRGAGTVLNAVGGLISGAADGIVITGNAGTVNNAGTISATAARGIGVSVGRVGTLTGIGTVTNSGTVVAGTNGIGIYLASGNVTNTGTIIASGSSGKAVDVRNGTFFNYGLVQGAISGISVSPTLTASGMVKSAGTVVGSTGIIVSAGTLSQTLTVAGRVVGTSGTALSLTPGGRDRLILASGAVFAGRADGGGGASVVEVATTGAAGAVDGTSVTVNLGSIANFSQLQVDYSATADASGTLSFDTLTNQGLINLAAGDALALGIVASAASAGTIDLRTGGSVHFKGSVAGNQTVLFRPPGGSVVLDHPEQFAGAITGFAGLDEIDLPLGTASFLQYSGDVLSLSYGGATIGLQVTTSYAAPQFLFTDDGSGGTAITVALAPGKRPPADFDGDGISDVLWRNDATGDTGFWGISNDLATWYRLSDSSLNYNIAGVGDLDGDGTADVLWRDNTGGDTGFWALSNNLPTWHDFGVAPTTYGVAGVGDFNGDGISDVLWRNNATGDTGYWGISGSIQTWHGLGQSPTTYNVVGVGDFSGDGTADILWRNPTSGDTGYWTIVNNQISGWVGLGQSPTTYSVVGVGDFSGDGIPDVLWRNPTSGDTGYWTIANNQISGWVGLGQSPTTYNVVGVGDFSGDGISDILWRNPSSGDTGCWTIANNQIAGWTDLGQAPTTYTVENGATSAGAEGNGRGAAFGFADIALPAAPTGAAAATGSSRIVTPPATGPLPVLPANTALVPGSPH